MFPLKDKVIHQSLAIYEGTCSCQKKYIGETKRNVATRFAEHDKMLGKSEPSKHVIENSGHSFTWKVLCRASVNTKKQKILEAFFIRKLSPSINDQLEIKSLKLFRNGIT